MMKSMHQVDAMTIPLAFPEILESDIEVVANVLRSGKLSTGPWVETFEADLARAVGTKFAVAVANGTCALHLIVKGLGIGPGDEIITTPYSFVASANAALFEGARPVFVDIDRETYNLDPAAVERALTPHTKAILAVDVFGRLADWKRLREIALERRLLLIEDACEALGTPRAGTFGNAASFGFYPNKQITSGEGGALVTDDEELATLARSFRNQGRAIASRHLVHDRLGFNYRLPDAACALLASQLKRLDRIVARRAEVAKWYNERLKETSLRLPMAFQGEGISWFVYVVELPERISPDFKTRFMEELAERGIETGPYFPAIHLQPYYRETLQTRAGMFPHTEYVAARTVALPFSTVMTEADVDEVSGAVKRVLKKHGLEGRV